MSDAECSSAKSKYEERTKKLRDLHLRRNEARKLNHQEVVDEDRRSKLPSNWETRQRRTEWEINDIEKRKEAEAHGDDYDRVKLLDIQADQAEKMEIARKRKKNPDQGFASFEDMAVRQYVRNTKQIKPDMQHYEAMKEMMGDEFYPNVNTLIQGAHYPSKDAIDKLVDDQEKLIQKREKHHRRRVFDPEAPIDYINEKNRRYNERIEKCYGQYTADIKLSLERGTAV